MMIAAEIKEMVMAPYAVYQVGKAFGVATLPFPALSEQSGTLILDLPQILPGDRFEPGTVKVFGSAYAGTLRHLAGVSVREAPEIINSGGSWGGGPGAQRGFILDFGGMRSVLRLLRNGTSLKYALVLPWLGTDFAAASLYPAHNGRVASRVPDDDGALQVSLRGAESQKLYVQIHGSLSVDEFLDQCVLETLVFPANLRASVADRPPFWTHPGPLQGETSMSGLAEALTSLAAELTSPLTPKLAIVSDAPGVITVPEGFAFLQAEKSAAASWAGNPGTTVALRAGVPSTLPMHFPLPVDGKTWILHSLKVSAAADLSPWIFEAIGPDPAGSPSFLRIDARFSAAQAFLPAQPVELHGVGLLLGAAADAELSVELCADDASRPAPGPALAVCMLSLSGPQDWREALFEKPLLLDPSVAYWIGIKAKSGTAWWSAAPAGTAKTALYAEDGTAWQPFPRMLPSAAPAPSGPGPKKTPVDFPAAGLRLFRTPRAEENQARVVVSHMVDASIVEMALPVSDEPLEVEWLWPEAHRPEIAPSVGGRGLDLGIRSLAGGTLDIASATLYFAWKGP